MNIKCENCGASHDANLPSWVLNSDRPFRFRCASCGHSQRVGKGEANAPAAPVEQPKTLEVVPTPEVVVPPVVEVGAPPAAQVPAVQSFGLYLKQEEKIYQIDTLATLQRWVIERRVMPHDLLSNDGINWEPAQRREELSSFFAAIEQIDTLIEATAEIHVPNPEAFEGPGVKPNPIETPAEIRTETPSPVLEEVSPEPMQAELPPEETQSPPLDEPIEADKTAASANYEESVFDPDLLDLPDLKQAPSPPSTLEEPISSDVDDLGVMADSATQESPKLPETPDFVDPFASFEVDEEIVTTESLPISVETSNTQDAGIDNLDFSEQETFEVSKDKQTAPQTAADFDDEAELDPLPEGQKVDSFYSSFEVPNTDPAFSEDWGPTAKPKSKKLLVGAVLGLAIIGLAAGEYLFSSTFEEVKPVTVSDPVQEIAAQPTPTETVAEKTNTTTENDSIASEKVEQVEQVEQVPAKTEPKPVKPQTATKAKTANATKKTTSAPAPAKEPTKKVTQKAATPPAPKSSAKPRSAAEISANLDKAWASVDIGRLDEAGKTFQSLLASNPTNADANFGYGYVLLEMGKSKTGQTYLCNALKYAKEGSSTHKEASGILKSNRTVCP